MKLAKKILATSLATVLVTSLFPNILLADAGTVLYDSETRTLHLSGNVQVSDVEAYNSYKSLRTVVADEGTVLPEDCSHMFEGNSAFVFDLSLADTSNVTNMQNMFKDCKIGITYNFDGWDTSKVKSMACMFSGCINLEQLDLTSFNTDSLVYQFEGGDYDGVSAGVAWMFEDCEKLRNIYVSDDWVLPAGLGTTGTRYTFTGCTSLVGGNGTKLSDCGDDASGYYACVDTKENKGLLTMSCCSLNPKTKTLTLYGDVNNDQVCLFADRDIVNSVVVAKNAIFPEYCNGMFDNFKATSIDLTNANTTHVNSMCSMFRGCKNLSNVVLPIDTSNVKTMASMFAGCSSLEMLDLSSFDTSGLYGEYHAAYAGMYEMFNGCSNLTTICVSDKWIPQAVYANTFEGCDKLVGGKGSTIAKYPVEDDKYAIIDGGESNPGFLTDINDVKRFSKLFPDANFCAYVMNLCGTTSDLITSADMKKIEETTELNLYDDKVFNISDFTGIEYFTNLTYLNCIGGIMKSLDVSKNTKLEKLYATKCGLLNTLKVNDSLVELLCGSCNLDTLDVSNCTKLTKLKCYDNKLTTLDVSNCTELVILQCNINKITAIDISKNTKLPYFDDAVEKQSYNEEGYNYVFWETDDKAASFYVDANVAITDGVTPEPTPANPTPANPTPANPTPANPTPAPELDVGAFVERCYKVGLNRESDKAGFDYWVDNLNNGKACGAQVGYGFIFSTEYIERNRTNEEFVNDLYSMYFDREPDEAGKAYWLDMLNNNVGRETVFAGFANSEEFYNLCTKYGVACGTYLEKVNNEVQGGVNCFVARLYKVCLNRLPDQGGHAGWVQKLMSGEVTGTTCAYGFVFSPEFIGKEPSNEDFVNYMYAAFFGRAADEEGFNAWVKVLEDGGTYEQVFNGFTGSAEFANLCAEYGINV